jgi:hypothetical protein
MTWFVWRTTFLVARAKNGRKQVRSAAPRNDKPEKQRQVQQQRQKQIPCGNDKPEKQRQVQKQQQKQIPCGNDKRTATVKAVMQGVSK